MRDKRVIQDVVECVPGLGPNLFHNSPMEACVVICRMNKSMERRNKVPHRLRVIPLSVQSEGFARANRQHATVL